MNFHQGVKIQAVNYSKVIKLLTDPHSVSENHRDLLAVVAVVLGDDEIV